MSKWLQKMLEWLGVYKKAKDEAEAKKKAERQAKADAEAKAKAEAQKPIEEERNTIRNLKWDGIADECGLLPLYCGGHGAAYFSNIAMVPIDFTCDFDSSGVSISIPASDETRAMAGYGQDHIEMRRAIACVFDSSGKLLEAEDFANSTFLDSRWKDKPVYSGLVLHVKKGQLISRTKLTEVV